MSSFREKREPRTIFDLEDEHFYKTLESVANAVSNSYQIQKAFIDDFVENLNISAAMLLMEPKRIHKRDRLEIRNCIKDLQFYQAQENKKPWDQLVRGAIAYLLEAIMVLRPTVREHFLRSLGIPDRDQETQHDKEEEVFR